MCSFRTIANQLLLRKLGNPVKPVPLIASPKYVTTM